MPNCVKIRKKKQQACLGDMRDRVLIELRSLTPPAGSSVDYTEAFTTKKTVWATVNTVKGEVLFDGTGTERDITHHITIRYIAGVTQEDWATYNSERMDVIDVTNLDGRKEFMLLRCSNRGTTANSANQA